MERLQLSGFDISPAMHVQMLKVLEQMGKDYLHKPEAIKYLLAPILVKSADQQKKFYDLFDQYLSDIQKPFPQKKSWYQKNKKRINLGILGLILGLIAGTIIYNGSKPDPLIFFTASPSISGDSTIFKPACKNLLEEHQLKWELKDEDDIVLETFDSNDSWILPNAKAGRRKTVELGLNSNEGEAIKPHRYNFSIPCEQAPMIDSINWPTRVRHNDSVTFKLIQESNRTYEYTWTDDLNFLDSSTDSLTFHFEKSGFQTIKVKVTLPYTQGECFKEIEHTVIVYKDQAIAPLAEKKLIKEPDHSEAIFKPVWWILLYSLLLLSFGLLYYLWKSRSVTASQNKPKEIQQIFEAPDKPPYFIPFRPMTHAIHAGKSLFGFANMLRQRQEGLRKELNIEKSLVSTIEKGGFPNIKLKRATQPSEYLFLIDEQHRDSIQSRLYEYLVDFLKDKDVYVERFFYNGEPFSLWKKKREEALSLQQLQRNYPYHHLVIMGDAHRYLSQSGQDSKALKKEYTEILERWDKRILLTPRPPISWTYKEAGISACLPIFPSDLEGVNAALDELKESSEEEEHTGHFHHWQEAQAFERPADIDVNYRKWRSLATLKNYLKDHPPLMKWLCALSVHPVISWDLTLAIGQGLEKEGDLVSFDKLLLLSRIPWLQQGEFPAKLRLQLLGELDPATKQLARQIVKEELSAVENLTKNSFVNFELQTGLVVQNFLLAPDNPKYQEAIRKLIQGSQPAIGKNRFKEIDEEIKKHQIAKGEKGEGLTSFLADAEGLGDKKTDATNPVSKYVWITGLVWLITLLLLWNLDGKELLYRLAFGERPPATEEITTAKENWIVKEVFRPLDLAASLNNRAVDVYEEEGPFRNILNRLNDAIDQREGDYPLAALNKKKYHYNIGIDGYQQYFETFEDKFLRQAKIGFEMARTKDSLQVDVLHGLGLVQWYQTDEEGATKIYDTIVGLDKNYFDSLPSHFNPNLKTLLFEETVVKPAEEEVIDSEPEQNQNAIQKLKGIVRDSLTKQVLPNVLVSGENIQVRTNEKGEYNISIPSQNDPNIDLSYQLENYTLKKEILRFDENGALPTIYLKDSLDDVEQYIEQYKDIAIREMNRSGIPASITLAQGMYESSWGKGALAENSNNHFGIKCKDFWTGPTYYIEDDDYRNGQLIKSCFRAYTSAEESFIDHTDFLVEGARYKSLFDYGKTDYVNWANGLKRAGYATDPNYAKKLIRLIEENQLYIFDEDNQDVIQAPIDNTRLNSFEGSLATAQQKAKAENKLLMAYFRAEWNAPNRIVEETTFADPGVIKKFNQNCILLKVDIDDFDGLAIKQVYSVRVLPTIIFFSPDGRVIEKYEKSLPSSKFLDLIDNALRQASKNEFIDPRDGQTYKTVVINGQVWMAENLNYKITGSSCYLEIPEFCDRLGRLYSWDAAKKACPPSWRLPKHAEWYDLLYDNSYESLVIGTERGLGLTLSGRRSVVYGYGEIGLEGYFWSEKIPKSNSNYIIIDTTAKGLRTDSVIKPPNMDMSCRCIKE